MDTPTHKAQARASPLKYLTPSRHRSKAAEMAFLNAYKVMREVPDPTLTLGAMLEELSAVMPLQAQYDKLEAELHQVPT